MLQLSQHRAQGLSTPSLGKASFWYKLSWSTPHASSFAFISGLSNIFSPFSVFMTVCMEIGEEEIRRSP